MTARSAPTTSLARWLVHRQIRRIETDRVIILEGDNRWVYGDTTDAARSEATVFVHDPRAYRDVAFGGTVGSGEAYMKGYWTADDLTEVVRVLLRNREMLNAMETGLARLTEPANRLFHWLSRNNKAGSRRNIAAHYDVGNEFFRIWLDESLMYSSAVFEEPGMSLEEASTAKLDRICRKLELSPDDHLLEIGTGWGGLAIHAAQKYGCRVTTTTISREQYRYVRKRIQDAGLTDRITLLLQDYRDLSGEYTKLVSVEMIEAIGHDFIDLYFEKCSSLLKKGGVMLLQAITIAEDQYETAKKSVDFIQRYIFPGGSLSSVRALMDSVARVTNLRLQDLEEIGPHYATTLRHWRERMASGLGQIRSLGYSEEFIRMWEFYFCYCEGGFIERTIGDVQILFVKPGSANARPPLRDLSA